MDDITRLRYLEKMGVVSYKARFQLSAAKPSVMQEGQGMLSPDAHGLVSSAAIEPETDQYGAFGLVSGAGEQVKPFNGGVEQLSQTLTSTSVEHASKPEENNTSSPETASMKITSLADIKARFFNPDGKPKVPDKAPSENAVVAVEDAPSIPGIPSGQKPQAEVALETQREEPVICQSAFQLSLFQPVPDVLLLNNSKHLGGAHFHLIKAIFFALQKPLDMVAPVRQFEWQPSADGANLRLAAQERLLAFLEVCQEHYNSRYLFVMGDDIRALLTPEPVFSSTITTVFLPSLQALISSPVLKKQVWERLSPFMGEI
ncbi:MAG: hypothetical protein KDI30_06975 [Pseudomonadales bacterium]|nr:hypothetical protein [Pseudomonadales bacterium]